MEGVIASLTAVRIAGDVGSWSDGARHIGAKQISMERFERIITTRRSHVVAARAIRVAARAKYADVRFAIRGGAKIGAVGRFAVLRNLRGARGTRFRAASALYARAIQ